MSRLDLRVDSLGGYSSQYGLGGSRDGVSERAKRKWQVRTKSATIVKPY